jgi:hypothetical protein
VLALTISTGSANVEVVDGVVVTIGGECLSGSNAARNAASLLAAMPVFLRVVRRACAGRLPSIACAGRGLRHHRMSAAWRVLQRDLMELKACRPAAGTTVGFRADLLRPSLDLASSSLSVDAGGMQVPIQSLSQ